MSHLFKKVIFIVFLLFIICPNVPTSAHSNLEKTFPKNSAQLEKSPQTVEAWFQDPVQIHSNTFVIKSSTGREYKTKKPFIASDNKGHIIAKLNTPLPSGEYEVEINTIALDGYVSKESYRFEVIKKEQLKKSDAEVKLLKASPSDGEIVKGSVKTLDLWFNQPVKISAIGVFDDKKKGLNKEAIIDPNDPNHVIIKFNEEINKGTYQVSWFVQQKEGNALSERMGVFYFSVNEFTAINPPEGTSTINWFANINLKQMSYWMAFMGFTILFGLAWFNHVINNRIEYKKWKKLSFALLIIAMIGEVLYLTSLRMEIPDLPFVEFLSLKFSWIALVQIGVITLGFITHRFNVYFYGISLLLFPVVVGHSSYPRYGGLLAMSVNAVHLLAIAIWIGGIFALITMVPKEERIEWLKANASKFSKWALGAVVLILLSGVWMTFKFVPSFSLESFIQSVWGRTIIIKTVLLLIMLFIAFSQQKVIRHLSEKLLRGFIIRLNTELLYGIIVLFFAGILVVSTPSAAEQGVYPEVLTKNSVTLAVEISPLYPGHNVISLKFDEDSNIKNTTVKLSMPPDWEKTNKAFKVDNNTFKLTGMNLHAAGTTYMEVKAEQENGNILTFPFKVVIPGEIRFNE